MSTMTVQIYPLKLFKERVSFTAICWSNFSGVFPHFSSVQFSSVQFSSPDMKSWLIWKDADAGKDWGQKEKGMTEDEMVGWHHWLNGHKSGSTLGVGDGQGGLRCCSFGGHKELDMTEWLNWTELTRQTSVGKVMSLLFNMLSMLVITFLPRSKHLLISFEHCYFSYCSYCSLHFYST